MLGRAHNCKETINRRCPAYQIKIPPKKQGVLDKSFLFDTVRHISRNYYFHCFGFALVESDASGV